MSAVSNESNSGVDLIVTVVLDDPCPRPRSFCVNYNKALKNSNLLHRLFSKEADLLREQIEIRKHGTMPRNFDANGKLIVSVLLKEKLSGTKFSDFSLRSLQNFWDNNTFLPCENDLGALCEMFVACSYLEMDDYTHRLRDSFVDVIGTAQSLDKALELLNVVSDFKLPEEKPEEKVFVSIFKNAWEHYGNEELEFRAREVASNSAPPVDSFRSVISRPPSSGNAIMSVPPEILKRCAEVEQNCKPDAKDCYICHNQFSYFYGYSAHTCRCCCARICGNCSASTELPFPPHEKIKSHGSLYSMWNKTTSGKEIVCKECMKILDDVGIKYSLCFQAMTAACLPVYIASRAASISQLWYDSAKDYVLGFRKLQHRLPTEPYTKEEKALIWMNRADFACHPLWIIQLLRVADWDDAKVCKEVHEIILKKVSGTPCSSLLCTKDCAHSGLRPIDCLVALNGHLFHLPQVIRCALVSILETAPDEELLNYIPQLVHYVRFDEFPYDILPVSDPLELSGANDGEGEGSCFGRPPDAVPNDVFNYEKCDKSPLIRMLLRRCLHGNGVWKDTWRQLCFEFYWAISVEASSGVKKSSKELRDFSYSGLYNHLRNAVVMRLSMNFPEGRQMLHGISSQYALMDILRDKERAKKQIGKLVERGTLFLPFDSSYVLSGVDLDHMKVMDSATKPVIMPYSCVPTKSVLECPDGVVVNNSENRDHGEDKKFMFKMDDLRNDLVVMKCTSIVKSIFAQDEVLKQLPCITYRIQPMTKSTGFVQIVNGTALSKIQSLNEYLLHIFGEGIGKVDEFIQSVAVTTVLVYLFGVGDRHKDNLLITTDGKLVNIDFGFLEGDDPMRCPYARIPADVINYQDKGRDNRKMFVEWCKCVFLQLRRYAMHFQSLLMFLHTTEEDSESTLNKFNEFVQKRFCVDCDEDEALKRLVEFLENSQKSWSLTVRDFFHEYGRAACAAVVNTFANSSKPEEENEEPTSPTVVSDSTKLKSVVMKNPSVKISRSTIAGSKQSVSEAPPNTGRVSRATVSGTGDARNAGIQQENTAGHDDGGGGVDVDDVNGSGFEMDEDSDS